MLEIIGSILFAIFITSIVAILLIWYDNSKVAQYVIIAISGATMMAHGTRVIIQTIVYPNTVYKAGLFDLVFDWMTLVILGMFVVRFGVVNFYLYEKKKFEKK